MSRRLFIIFSLLIIPAFAACSPQGTDSSPNATTPEPALNGAAESTPPREKYSREIGDSNGLIVLSESYGENDTVRIYNKGGAVWYEFSYYDEAAFDELESINTDFRPFSFHPDYLVLAMRVVGEDSALYEVVVNEESDLRKFVRKNDPVLKYEEFGEHLKTVYAIDFDTQKNPVLSQPDGEPVMIEYSKVRIFKPEEADGDWVKISWQLAEASAGNAESIAMQNEGWIRWKDGSKMIVEIYYVA
ncbi:MAG: hypothetical protein DWQ47_02205 [Acidobacteria bacterium]|nr:MAG: hypothetical protein DWQ32_05755 [Acidobacteriota bacterium]REK01233.1 MAG: hypothetical protein DWQ38_02190 [Acidobacteriota bacterium]REK14189.1 MAG: hypothetical protein DWQ43_11445 [Acidobacteriota bacterium]REK44904.1 MAG: hypothetical protein DWQ47_02205 [Acidobacteriota bacterium]